jgi:hypothetical protein
MALDLGELGISLTGDLGPIEEAFQRARGEADEAGRETGQEYAVAVSRAITQADLDQAGRVAGEEISDGVQQGSRDAGEGAADNLSQAKPEFISAGAALGLAAGTALTAGITEAIQQVDARAVLVAQTGSPAMAEEIGRIAGNVYGRGFGEGLSGATEAVQAIMSSGLIPAGDEARIQALTVSVQAYADAWGTEAAEAAAVVSAVLNNNVAPTAENAMDLIVAASQRVPVALREDMLEAVIEYTPFLHQMGLSGAQAFKVIVDSSMKGKFALDKTGDAVKEFSLKATTLADTADAYKELGLNGEKMASAITKGGPPATAALKAIVTGLLKVKDPAKQADLAITFFGTPLEDLGKNNIPSFLKSLSGVGPGLDGVTGSAKRAADSIEGSTGHKIEAFKNRVHQAFIEKCAQAIPYIEKITKWMTKNEAAVKPAVAALVTFGAIVLVIQGAMKMWAGATLIYSAAQWVADDALAAFPLITIFLLIMMMIGGFILLYNNCETFRNVVNTVFGFVLGVIKGVWNWIQDNWQLLLAILTGPIGMAVLFITRHWDAIKHGAAAVKDWIVDRWNGLVDFITGIPGRISSAASGMWNGIRDSFKEAINFIVRGWNNLSLHIPSVDTHIPGVGTVGGMTLDTPNIPYLATGGDITRAGMAMVGERGPELLSLPTGARVTPLGGGGAAGQQPVPVQITGRLTVDGTGVLSGLRQEIAWRGGNVQATLGAAA